MRASGRFPTLACHCWKERAKKANAGTSGRIVQQRGSRRQADWRRRTENTPTGTSRERPEKQVDAQGSNESNTRGSEKVRKRIPHSRVGLIAGNWELIWTAQDSLSLTERRLDNLFGFINPLENQSYSNNPGRSNPILPRQIQVGLEEAGVLSERGDNSAVSTQAIDLKRGRIRNVVAFEVNNPTPILRSRDDRKTKGFVTVDVLGSPNPSDGRRIDVKFDSCRVNVLDSPVDLKFPLGIIGPTGWLRTLYVDDNMRITRGHKGSVFILSRTSK